MEPARFPPGPLTDKEYVDGDLRSRQPDTAPPEPASGTSTVSGPPDTPRRQEPANPSHPPKRASQGNPATEPESHPAAKPMNYRDTLNLPQDILPMRANLPQREPEFQQLWERADVYRKSVERDCGRG